MIPSPAFDLLIAMPSLVHITATLIVLAMGGSATAFAQNTQTAENPKADAHTWGPDTNGLTLSIGVDKTTYVVGDAIALHVAFRNISARNAVTLDPCKRAKLMVRNAMGEKFDQIDGDLSCSVSNPCEPVVNPGEIVASEVQSLTDYRLPPGTYTVTGDWVTVAYLGPPKTWNCLGPRGTEVFHVHASPVTIRIGAVKQP